MKRYGDHWKIWDVVDLDHHGDWYDMRWDLSTLGKQVMCGIHLNLQGGWTWCSESLIEKIRRPWYRFLMLFYVVICCSMLLYVFAIWFYKILYSVWYVVIWYYICLYIVIGCYMILYGFYKCLIENIRRPCFRNPLFKNVPMFY